MHFKAAGSSTVFHVDPPTEVSADGQLIVCHSSSSWPIDVLTAGSGEMIDD
jgi:hypothetical protein